MGFEVLTWGVAIIAGIVVVAAIAYCCTIAYLMWHNKDRM